MQISGEIALGNRTLPRTRDAASLDIFIIAYCCGLLLIIVF